MPAQRTEQDLLGQQAVPADALYGIYTVRAAENFPLARRRPSAPHDIAETGAYVGRDSLDAELRFYDAAEQGIEVVRILHGARDVGALLADEISDGPAEESAQE